MQFKDFSTWINICLINHMTQMISWHRIWMVGLVMSWIDPRLFLTNNHQVLNRFIALQWRHNEHDGVSNHQPYDCLLNRLFIRRWKKTSKLRVTGLCEGCIPRHKGPVTRKMFPFDDVIMKHEYVSAFSIISPHWKYAVNKINHNRLPQTQSIAKGINFLKIRYSAVLLSTRVSWSSIRTC